MKEKILLLAATSPELSYLFKQNYYYYYYIILLIMTEHFVRIVKS